MIKHANYEINFVINTITVTKRFLAAASQIGTQEYATMTELRKLQMPITVREIHRTVTLNEEHTPSLGCVLLLTRV